MSPSGWTWGTSEKEEIRLDGRVHGHCGDLAVVVAAGADYV